MNQDYIDILKHCIISKIIENPGRIGCTDELLDLLSKDSYIRIILKDLIRILYFNDRILCINSYTATWYIKGF